MADVTVTRAHSMGVEAAATAVDRAIRSGGIPGMARFDWSADRRSADFSGSQFTGTIYVSEESVTVSVELGFLAKAFRGEVERRIEGALASSLG